MFSVPEVEAAAAIRAVYEQCGELSAAVELRRLFPGIFQHRPGKGVCAHHRGLEAAAAAPAPPEGKQLPAPDALRRITVFPGSARRGRIGSQIGLPVAGLAGVEG